MAQQESKDKKKKNFKDDYNLPKNFVNSDDQFPDEKYLRYQQRNDDRTVAPGSVNIDRDTLYRVGGYDPYESGNYYSQDQLNNAMSGNDANAIYYATHQQDAPWTYGSNNYDPYNDMNSQEHVQWLRDQGLKFQTGAQEAMPIYGDGAYVGGAGVFSNPLYDEALPQGVGSAQGIPYELLDAESKKRKYNESLMNLLLQSGYRPKDGQWNI